MASYETLLLVLQLRQRNLIQRFLPVPTHKIFCVSRLLQFAQTAVNVEYETRALLIEHLEKSKKEKE